MFLQRPPHRRLIAAASIVVALLLSAVPATYGAKPFRTVLPPSDPVVIPAGQGCSFDVLEEPGPDARPTITVFDDGRTVLHAHANATLTNVDTGASFAHRARFHLVQRYDPETNQVSQVVSGQVFITFWAGDQGPYGVVSEPGLMLRFTGTAQITADAETGVYSEFSSTGFFTDICALLS